MTFEPENDLERSLVRAAEEPAYRGEFYREFLEAQVFVIQDGPAPTREEEKALSKGTDVALRTYEREGVTVIPFFTSQERLRAFIQGEARYLGLKAKALLTLTKGAMLVLNPGSEYGKEFAPEEVAAILDGTIWQQLSGPVVVPKETRVMVGQPARYPTEFVEALCLYFKSVPEVRKAYLAHYGQADEKAHTLIAIEMDGDWEDVSAGVGKVAGESEIPDPPVDVMQMKGERGLEDYFRDSVKPFYVKKRFLGLI
jgi:hypothetical protein